MPFKSEAQRRLLWAKHPEMAKRWAEKAPGQKSLPKHVKQGARRSAILQQMKGSPHA